jgi:two-component sensor histidine kinase
LPPSKKFGLDLERAIPCALLINELVTNAFKHAFPSGRRGAIGLSLKAHGDREAVLTVCDDGVGLPPGFASMREHHSACSLCHCSWTRCMGACGSGRGRERVSSCASRPVGDKR